MNINASAIMFMDMPIAELLDWHSDVQEAIAEAQEQAKQEVDAGGAGN